MSQICVPIPPIDQTQTIDLDVMIDGEKQRILSALGLAPDGRRVVDPSCDLPDASWIARLAARRLVDGSVPELALVEPVYLRDPDAKKPKGMPKLFTKA